MIRHCVYCGRSFSYDHEEKCREGKKGRRVLYQYLISIINEFQIPIRPSKMMENVSWNGHTIGIPTDPARDLSGLRIAMHEIAHWFYATSDERTDPSFKLGPGDQKREQNVYAIEALLDKKAPIETINELINSIRQKEDVIRRNSNPGP